MLFKFKARKASGEVVEGERESTDRLTLAHEMRGEGLSLFSAEAVRGGKAGRGSGGFLLKLFPARVKLKDKIVFAGNLSSMISAGLTLSRALEVLERQTTNRSFKAVIHSLLERINGGESFSQALGSYSTVFPPEFVFMVAAGEESGKLPDALINIREQLNKTFELRRKVTGAMIYPAVILALIFVIGVLMMVFMVPTLTATFQDLNVELPFMTRLVIAISDFLKNHFIIFFGTLAALGFGLYSWSRTVSGQHFFDFAILHMPAIGELNRQYNSAVIMRTISSLVSAGVNMTEAIEITAKVVQNSYFQKVMMASSARIQTGAVLSKIFADQPKLFPILVPELTEVGEETGNLAEMLGRGAAFYEGEIDQATKNLSTIIEPLMMIFIGVAVGFFVYAMIGPMYSLTDAIG